MFTNFVIEESFEVMQKNASEQWIFITQSLPVYFLCFVYPLIFKKLTRATLFFQKDQELSKKITGFLKRTRAFLKDNELFKNVLIFLPCMKCRELYDHIP